MAEIIIRLLRDDNDIRQINDLYFRAYQIERSIEKFKWEYQQGPLGPAIYVVAINSDTNTVIGTQCAIPLYVTNALGEKILSAKSEDTLVDKAYRGQNVLAKMMAFQFDECKRAGIVIFWGFTYAIKAIRNVGWDLPFKCENGLIVYNSGPAYKYLDSLKAGRTFVEKVKIAGLVTMARLKFIFNPGLPALKGHSISREVQDSLEHLPPQQPGAFYLQLDSRFLEWRVRTNPYPKKHLYYSLLDSSGKQVGSVICSHTAEVSFIMHLAFAHDLSDERKLQFLNSVIQDMSRQTSVLRFWGFTHNSTGKQEIALLRRCGFIFATPGISFMWKKLDEKSSLDYPNFVLSRMASQGT